MIISCLWGTYASMRRAFVILIIFRRPLSIVVTEIFTVLSYPGRVINFRRLEMDAARARKYYKFYTKPTLRWEARRVSVEKQCAARTRAVSNRKWFFHLLFSFESNLVKYTLCLRCTTLSSGYRDVHVLRIWEIENEPEPMNRPGIKITFCRRVDDF